MIRSFRMADVDRHGGSAKSDENAPRLGYSVSLGRGGAARLGSAFRAVPRSATAHAKPASVVLRAAPRDRRASTASRSPERDPRCDRISTTLRE